MAVKLDISYETLVELVDQLPPEQKRALMLHLLQQADERPLTAAERKAVYHNSVAQKVQTPSLFSHSGAVVSYNGDVESMKCREFMTYAYAVRLSGVWRSPL